MRFLPLLGAVTLSFTSISKALDIQGEPDAHSELVKEHAIQRERLITLEKTHRQDHLFKQQMSSVAQQADEIVRRIRQDEIDNYWRHAGTLERPTDERFAGEDFSRARPYIANTTLWKVVKEMPKGSLLHAHLSAMLPYEKLVETVINTEGMVITASQPVDTKEAKQNATIEFSHVNTTVTDDGPSIDDPKYVPNTKVPVKHAADSFEGGQEGFLEFIKTKTTILPEESIRHELGVDEIWRRFQACFEPAGTLLNYEPVVRKFYQLLFSSLADDKISWVEIRAGGSSGKLIHEGNEDPDPDLDIWWTVLVEELDNFKKTEKGKNFWGARVIWSDARVKSPASITSSMKVALQRKANFPDLFSGYDLLAQEDLGGALIDLAPQLIWFRQQAENLNLTIPFFFHAGETLGDGNTTDSNLFDALLFDTRRIGHGFSLYKHPDLIQKMREQNVMVEVCPISNEVLRLNTDVLHHPLPAMIAHGVPTAISNDDPAILGQDVAGLSYDFYEVIQAFDNLGLGGLGALAQNSLRWSNFEDQSDEEWLRDVESGELGDGTKAKRIQEWNTQWEEFCEWIVKEFGDQYGDE